MFGFKVWGVDLGFREDGMDQQATGARAGFPAGDERYMVMQCNLGVSGGTLFGVLVNKDPAI